MIRSSRRTFLAAGGAGLALAACGSSSSGAKFTSVARLDNQPLFVPGESRIAVSLVDSTGTFVPDGPSSLRATVVDADGKSVTKVTGTRRADGITIAYWPFRFTVEQAGFYTLKIDGDLGQGNSFGVYTPAEVTMPYIGAVIQPFDTPTVSDHRGVEPYCSQTPAPCPLHDITLTQALASGKPVVYMVGTPAHCQTGTCSPSLDILTAAHARLGDSVAMVHADVYADNAGTQFAPAVGALGLSYEPVAYFCTSDGTIVDRLDALWDASELDESIARITG